MAEERAMAHRKRADIGRILREVKTMVRESKDPRATALAELKEEEDGDPFRILIGTILSQRTRDERTTLDRPNAADRVVARSFYRTLRESGYSPKELLAVSTELIELVTRDLEKQG